jgi:hypothetical protein
MSRDLRKGYLQIFQVSPHVDGSAAVGGTAGEGGEAAGAVEVEADESGATTALLAEFISATTM